MRECNVSIDPMEVLLLKWAAWLNSGGRGSGYPVTNVLHESWLPPTPGTTPTMKTAGRGEAMERSVHVAVRGLSSRMQNTLLLVYVMRCAETEQVLRLQCAASTIDARVREAKRVLRLALALN